MVGLFGLVWMCGVLWLGLCVLGWYPVIFWVHLVSSCIIWFGRWGISFCRVIAVMGIPLAILSLMME